MEKARSFAEEYPRIATIVFATGCSATRAT